MSPGVLPGQDGEPGDDQDPTGQDWQDEPGQADPDQSEPDQRQDGPARATDDDSPDGTYVDGPTFPLEHPEPPCQTQILPEAVRGRKARASGTGPQKGATLAALGETRQDGNFRER